ncbi:MAG: hypothetical protein CL855_00345 [Cryomorphaceae bacterium]|nr:hypothetical protein [Cryomorphaceae bacterium]
MNKFTAKSSYYNLGAYKLYDLYAEKVILDNKKKIDSEYPYFGDLYADLVAVTFLGKLDIPLFELFPSLRIDLPSEDLKFDHFIDNHINEHYGATHNLIARYIKSYQIKHTSHPFGGRPNFRPVVHPFEMIEKITPKDVKHKYKWFQPYEYATNHIEKLNFVERVLKLELDTIKNEAENSFRSYLGLKPKAPRWISEQNLYDRIKLEYKNLLVVSQASPDWLERQRFDIYFPEINAAIEYNGAQHYKAVGLFGGEEGLKQTKKRDALKRKKCNDNKCDLLEVSEDYNLNEVFNWIDQILTEKAERKKNQ